MTRTFNFSSAVNLQLMRLAADQSNYQRNYVTLALFLVGIKKSFINDMCIPKQYQEDVSTLYNDIKNLVTNYASTLGVELVKYPTKMIENLDSAIKLLGDAISASDNMNANGFNTDDYQNVIVSLTETQAIAKLCSDACGIIIKNFDKFYSGDNNGSGDLCLIDEKLQKLVKDINDSIKFDSDYKQDLENDINEMLGLVNENMEMIAGIGITVGVSIFLGACGIAIALLSGAGAPVAAAIAGVVGLFIIGGGIGAYALNHKINTLQETISEKGKLLSDVETALVQLDLYSKTYSGLVDQVDKVKTSVTEMQKDWSSLSSIIGNMLNEIKASDEELDDLKNLDWGKMSEELKDIQTTANKVKDIATTLDVSNIKVSTGDYNFAMTQENVQTVFDNSEQMNFIEYLLSA